MEGVSSAAIEVLVQNLINLFKDEYSLLRGLDEDAQRLQRTLGTIQAYLTDAEKKSITQDSVRIWLRELEAVAFDADNVLDELSYHLLHKKVHKMKSSKDKVLSCFSSFNGILRRRNMAHTIKQINATFECMNKRATDLGLQSMIVNAPAIAHTSIETDSISLDPIFIGRNDDVSKLVDMLTQIPEDRIFSMVALVGMGGIGKTTLTRKVFNHESIKARFGSLIWVHVSQTFDPFSLFKKILSELTSDVDGVESRELILKRLHEVLKSKTYLLVLDDIWNEDVAMWEDFINSMSGVTSTTGNGILITTRSEKVASTVNPFHIHHLNGLSNEDCWSIIKAKTFDINGEVPYGFEMIGRKIATRCQGLPLAANVVGGVLRGKSEEEWRFINENWLSDGEGGENISKILKLSFDHLSSPSLKKCFTFCSVFPKGKYFDKEELIELWMAEGFLQPSPRYDMESVGNMFFNVLAQNYLLEVQWIDNVWFCGMHDLVHDLASYLLSNNADGSTPVRYMVLKKESSPIPKNVAKHLRTLFMKSGIPGTIFSNFECLHNLTLSGDYKELPNSIRELVHLRNLNIYETRIVNLPKWIGKLHHLQTLRASWELENLPSTLKYMYSLRHLYIWSLTKLPAKIGGLTSLQTLPYFTVGKKKGYQIEELGSLMNLKGSLKIQDLEMVHDKEEALKADIFHKLNLFDLAFTWSDDREDERNDASVLEGLQPHANLKKLKISGFKGNKFPTWAEKMAVRDGLQSSWVPLENLIEITFSNCSEIDEIPKLQHLPNLKSLSLKELKKVKFINTSFNHLTSLDIDKLDALECLPEWLFYKNQNLSYLDISRCPLLRELPDGLDTLNSLEYLCIWDCENLKSIWNPSGGARQSQGILCELKIARCGELMELPCEMLESWAPTIEHLVLNELRSLKNLPMLIDCLAKSSTRLTYLSILGVPKLMAASIGSVESWDLSSLQSLWIDVSVEWSREDSVGIAETVDGMLQTCCNSLTILYLKGVENWEWLPQSIQYLTSVSVLRLENIGVEELPQWLGNLSSLRELYLNSCNKLKRLPFVDALKHLMVNDCPELRID
ncbi:disease resistance protein RGA2-like [Salvia hispanica]|uniref:disease resistance protein RGA2-like n=1 Tax=Salvia hispanica TaxID=49212 RepID=UPI002009CBDB|nr:disease resistance protein RGA2-like [Salvia hispanica]XP_047978426.1 disease resistance protein RGA2-like [Salvia hispanica]XP_047978431.1 disease resistance protein RGA2-like [Salvia hispanica]